MTITGECARIPPRTHLRQKGRTHGHKTPVRIEIDQQPKMHEEARKDGFISVEETKNFCIT